MFLEVVFSSKHVQTFKSPRLRTAQFHTQWAKFLTKDIFYSKPQKGHNKTAWKKKCWNRKDRYGSWTGILQKYTFSIDRLTNCNATLNDSCPGPSRFKSDQQEFFFYIFYSHSCSPVYNGGFPPMQLGSLVHLHKSKHIITFQCITENLFSNFLNT